MFITSALISFCPPFSVLPPHLLRCPPNIMPSDLNPPPLAAPLHSSQLMSDFRWTTVCVCVCASVCVCVFSCVLKGSGWVARTIGPPTAYCSEALSGKFPSKHHGKTIKTTSKSLLLSFTFFLLFVLLLLLPLSLYLSPFRRSTLTRPSFHTSRGKVLTLAAGCGRSQSPCWFSFLTEEESRFTYVNVTVVLSLNK